ncbi:MAG: cytochrome c oxidase, subunit [Clostridia bacterium]|jgi:cytochrome c oxidase subunit 2|nr:cytochrome c oxidase, subunit [Clostridia bacterium]
MYPLVSAVNKVDFAFILIYSIAAVVLLGITFAMVYFLFKYNKKRHPEPADIKGNLLAEVLWTVIPTIIFMGMFFVGWDSFVALRSVPKNAIEINVEGKMWSWKFTYPNGKVDKELYVPINKPVKLNITSADVIHSFYVPAYRIKIDAVPGLTTYAWFNPNKKGDYDILCAEYCGVRHAYMLSKVHVVDEEEYAKFISGEKEKTANVTLPELLDKYGCSDCHSLNGEVLVGPPLNDIKGRKTIVIIDGKEKEIVADEKYIKDSILYPGKEIVKDFENIMPPYDGEIPENELNTLVDLMLNKKQEISNIEVGKKLIDDEGCTGCHSTDGSIIAAPSFKNLYNAKKQVIKDGKEYTVTADEEYIYVSTKYPEREIVKGFDPIMPPFDYLTDEQIKAITEYIKSLK